MNGLSRAEFGWRGFLSLRDPAGSAHAAGPPEIVIATHNCGIRSTLPVGRGNATIIRLFTMHSRAAFESEYPFPSRFFDLDGVRYHYVDEGHGETLLCVHGNPTWSFAWRNLIKDLSRDYRVLAVDHIGCGFSDKPQAYEYRLSRHIENLSRFVVGLDLKNITLLAHDWGGAIGMGAAGQMPKRFSRFVLFNTAAFRSQRMPFRIAVCRWPLVGASGVRGMNLFA